MDEEYAKQVCNLMGWEPVTIKVPQPSPDPATGHQPNNPGYCFLTFSTPAHAANVLAQVNNSPKGGHMIMPNSSKPFALNWAPAVPASMSSPPAYTKEYSIFVGDLAPETSNSDLVAVFRNPVLGLRNDREPKFIRPFLSCKSAKIMLDPVTGISRGYGFVRFTDEADQQRALIEMHGLYCLSRPMRISPATAKFKPPASGPLDFPQGPFNAPSDVTLPLPAGPQPKSVSAPIAATNSNSSLGSNSIQGSSSNNSVGGSSSGGSLSSNAPVTLPQGFPNNDSARLGNSPGVPSLLSEPQLRHAYNDPYFVNEESWKHHSQARAILGNLIGPNGEQLTSTDPYNTTVFVGGLSPLISEETLRTFFAPFGDIHYVKVPVGKHCGFVQFVRKADAERAIEKMQGFPIGGSRIRLSWGRSQYKAAQAAAQAAQAAALQAHYSAPTVPPTSPANANPMTPDQALALLYKLSQQGYISPGPTGPNGDAAGTDSAFSTNHHLATGLGPEGAKLRSTGNDTPQNGDAFGPSTALNGGYMQPRPDIQRALSNFSPFSPDPNSFTIDDSKSFGRSEALPHPSKAYAPGFYPPRLQTSDLKYTPNGTPAGKLSPGARPLSASRYAVPYLDSGVPMSERDSRAVSRPDPSSRPPSGQLHTPAPVTISRDRAEADHNDLEDLNGTLASLDLDRSWHQSQLPDVSNNSNRGPGPGSLASYHGYGGFKPIASSSPK